MFKKCDVLLNHLKPKNNRKGNGFLGETLLLYRGDKKKSNSMQSPGVKRTDQMHEILKRG